MVSRGILQDFSVPEMNFKWTSGNQRNSLYVYMKMLAVHAFKLIHCKNKLAVLGVTLVSYKLERQWL